MKLCFLTTVLFFNFCSAGTSITGPRKETLSGAVYYGDITKVRQFLKKGADTNAKRSAVSWLGGKNSLQIAKLLIEHGAVIDKALHNKASLSDVEVAKLFIKHGADVNAKDSKGNTPLHSVKNMEVAKVLIENGADVNARDIEGNTPLHKSVREYYRRPYCSPFTERICPPHDYTKKLETTKFLIKKGADVNAKNKSGETPLFYVGNLEIAKLLIENGADVNVANSWNGYTPLHNAENLEMVKLLIENGADVNAGKETRAGTPLSDTNNIKIAKLLIENGADVNAMNKKGQTPCDTVYNRKVKNLIIKNGGKCWFHFHPYITTNKIWYKLKNLFKKK